MKLCLLLANGFEDLEAVGTIALLRRGGVEVDLFTIEEQAPIGKYGMELGQVKPISLLKKENYQMIVLPGGPGVASLKKHEAVIELLHYFYRENLYLAAICAAPTILGSLGMLEGKTYTCFPGMQEDAFLGEYVQDKAVIDGTIITGKAAGAVTDFALAILSVAKDVETANRIRQEVYY